MHRNGDSGRFLLPEITGAGGALFDYDGDGDLDLYLVQSGGLGGDDDGGDRLYRNELERGAPRFVDVTEQSGIRAREYGMGAAVEDYDGDGDLDLYVTNLGPNQLWRNDGDGRFVEVAAEAGVDDPAWSVAASFFDYDGDGRPDLYVANYVQFEADDDTRCYAPSSARDYCGPDAYRAEPDRLYRNRGDGTFEDVSERAGLRAAAGAGLGVVAADFTGDGRTDVYVANDGDPNQLWADVDGSGRLRDEALLGGLALNRDGRAEAGMGVAVGDADSDGDEDVFVTHLDGESNTLYVNLGDGLFEDRTLEAGLHAASLASTGFGTSFLDYDNDGRLDLLVVNGAVRTMEAQARRGDPYPLRQTNQLFRNAGESGFRETTAEAGAAFARRDVSRGAIRGDLDDDGDIDVVVTNNNGPARVLLNRAGQSNGWLGLRLRRRRDGVDLSQVVVEAVTANGERRVRRSHRDGSYASSGDARVVIGLGAEPGPVRVRVRWPDGTVETWPELAPQRYWTLVRGDGVADAEDAGAR